MLIIRRRSYNILGLKLAAPTKFLYKKTADSAIGWALVRDAFNGFPLTLPAAIDGEDFQIYKNEFLIDNRSNDRIIFRIELIGGLNLSEIENKLRGSAMYTKGKPFCFLFSTDNNLQIMLLSNKNIYGKNRTFYKRRAKEAMDFVLNYIDKNPSQVIVESN